jgi:hypothetical protein
MRLNDELKAWLAPLVSEAHDRGLELSGEILTAAKPPEGKLYGPMNWVLFGELVIRRLGWEETYPEAPNSERRTENA